MSLCHWWDDQSLQGLRGAAWVHPIQRAKASLPLNPILSAGLEGLLQGMLEGLRR